MQEREDFWTRARDIVGEVAESTIANIRAGLEWQEAVLATGRAAATTVRATTNAATDLARDTAVSAADLVLEGADVSETLEALRASARRSLTETGREVYESWRAAGWEANEAAEAAVVAVRESGEALQASVEGFEDVLEALPPEVRFGLDAALAFVPLSDGLSLLQEGYNYLTGEGIDPVNFTLSTLGLAGDLGWLNGFVIDPLDGLNGGAAALKAAYRQMDEPAKEVFGTLLRKTLASGDEIGTAVATLARRTSDLLPHTDTLASHPNAIARLLNLDDDAFRLALSGPEELTAAIARSDFLDRFASKSIPDLLTPDGQDFARVYERVEGSGIFRSLEPGYPSLRLRDGKLQEIVEAAPGLNPVGRAIDAAGEAFDGARRRLSESKLAELWENAPKWVKDGIEKNLAEATLPIRDGVKTLKEFFKGVESGQLDVAKASISALKQAQKINLLGDFRLFAEPGRSPEDLNAGLDLLEDIYDELPDGAARESLAMLLDRVTERDIDAARLSERLIDLAPHAEALRQHPEALPVILSLPATEFELAASSPTELNRAIQRSIVAPAISATPAVPATRSMPVSPRSPEVPNRRAAASLGTRSPRSRDEDYATLGPGFSGPEVGAVYCYLYHGDFLALDDLGDLFELPVADRDNIPGGFVEPSSPAELAANEPVTLAAAENRPTLSLGSTGSEVFNLQTYLYQEGYLAAAAIDGQFDAQTEAAVREYQRDRNLTADGVANSQTWQALLEGVPTPETSASQAFSSLETRETPPQPGRQAIDAAEASETFGGRLWQVAADAITLAIADGRGPQLDVPLAGGESVEIAGDPESQIIFITGAAGDRVATLQFEDGQFAIDIRDPETAAALVERLEPLLAEATASEREVATLE